MSREGKKRGGKGKDRQNPPHKDEIEENGLEKLPKQSLVHEVISGNILKNNLTKTLKYV